MSRYYQKKRSFPSLIFVIVAVVLCFAIYFSKGIFSEDLAVASSSGLPTSSEQIEKKIVEVIKNNPELIINALKEGQEIEIKKQQDQVRALISKHIKEIENTKNSPFTGNERGDVTIVEFFDYRCGYCKNVNKTIKELIASDNKIKFVYKQMPILGDESLYVAKSAVAVFKLDPSKFVAYHDKLMETENLDKNSIEKIVVDLGIDKDAFKAKIEDPEIKSEIDKTKHLAKEVKISGTPAFVINGQFLPGAADLESFKNKIAEVRKKK